MSGFVGAVGPSPEGARRGSSRFQLCASADRGGAWESRIGLRERWEWSHPSAVKERWARLVGSGAATLRSRLAGATRMFWVRSKGRWKGDAPPSRKGRPGARRSWRPRGGELERRRRRETGRGGRRPTAGVGGGIGRAGLAPDPRLIGGAPTRPAAARSARRRRPRETGRRPTRTARRRPPRRLRRALRSPVAFRAPRPARSGPGCFYR